MKLVKKAREFTKFSGVLFARGSSILRKIGRMEIKAHKNTQKLVRIWVMRESFGCMGEKICNNAQS